MKIKIIKLIVGVIFVFTTFSTTSCENRNNEVVWYISTPRDLKYYDDIEKNQIIENDVTKAINERIKQLGIDAKIVFKYYSENEINDTSDDITSSEDITSIEYLTDRTIYRVNYPKRVLESDSDADIVLFSSINKDMFLDLDEYLVDDNAKVIDAIIKKRLDANRVNGKIKYLPKGLFDVEGLAYSFDKEFIEKNDIKLDQVSKMNVKEVIEYLLPYFKDQRVVDDKYRLTSEGITGYYNMIDFYYNSITRFYNNESIMFDFRNNKFISYLDIDIVKDWFYLTKWVYDENIDAHIEMEKSNSNLEPVFSITSSLDIPELMVENNTKSIKIPISERYIFQCGGNGILKESNQKDLAVDVLCATMYDEQLSNLFIYGIEGKDYHLVDGYVEFDNEDMNDDYRGSMNVLGNEMITTPRRNQVQDKKARYEKIVDDLEIRNNYDFVVNLEGETLVQTMRLRAIMMNAISQVENSKIDDMDDYLHKLNQQFKDEGVDKVVEELQKQLDKYLISK